MSKTGLVSTKALSRAFPARVEAHARSVFLQREIRQSMLQHLRESEAAHIGQRRGPVKGQAGAAHRFALAAALTPQIEAKNK